jgi:hypothetical protein
MEFASNAVPISFCNLDNIANSPGIVKRGSIRLPVYGRLSKTLNGFALFSARSFPANPNSLLLRFRLPHPLGSVGA